MNGKPGTVKFTDSKEVFITLKVMTGRKQNRLYRDSDGRLICELTAKPFRGQANKEVLRFLYQKLNSKCSRITIEKGFKSSTKLLKISNIENEDLETKLSLK